MIYRGDDHLFVCRWEQIVEMREKVDIVQIISWNSMLLYPSPLETLVTGKSRRGLQRISLRGSNQRRTIQPLGRIPSRTLVTTKLLLLLRVQEWLLP